MTDQAPPSKPDYPRYFATFVSVAPDKVIHFSADDMKALVDAFTLLTTVNVLDGGKKPAEVMDEYCRDLMGA